MWSNWNSFNNMQTCEFGPGWFCTTPLYPHVWKSNIRYLDDLIYSEGNVNELIYEKPKNLISIDHKSFSIGLAQTYDIQLTLNPGWYYINDTYTTASTHDSSGLKYWYYLKETIHSEVVTVIVNYDLAQGVYTISSPTHPQEIVVENNGTFDVHVELPIGIVLDDLNYVSGGEFQSGDSDSGADRVEVKIKPKLGSGTTDDLRTPSYIGYVTFEDIDTPFLGEGKSVGSIRAKYLNNINLDLSSMNRVDLSDGGTDGLGLDRAGSEASYNDTILPDETTEFI